MHYLEDRVVMHRNLKPENVFFTAEGVVRIAGFGE
jgi:serine/threonine protein kinase